MAKVIINIGYRGYVVDAAQAIALSDILSKAERYDSKYKSKEDGGTTYHIWEQTGEDSTFDMRILTESMYRMAKLAGEPVET